MCPPCPHAPPQVGDEVLFWQSGKASAAGVYALYSVARAAYPDPEDEKNKGFLAFDLKLEEHFDSEWRAGCATVGGLACCHLASAAACNT